MSQPRPNKPDKGIERLCQEAGEAWRRQDYQKSISLLELAVQKDPSNSSLHLNLARAHGLRYDYSAVERCLEKALQVSQGRVQILEEAAGICSAFKNLDMMLGYLERASQKKGVSIDALISLADIYVLDNRMDEAAEVVERAARMDRKDPRVLLKEALLKQQRGQVNEAESQFRDVLANSAADALTRVRAAYTLAGILDGAGQYDEAMTALLEGKAIQRTQAAVLAAPLQQMQNLNQEMARAITPAILDRWRADAARLQPARRLALLAGHPRSGTTLLEQVLEAHSDVISLEETTLIHDEIYRPMALDFPPGAGIFQMLDSAPPSVLRHLRENYFCCAERFLRQAIGSRLLVDKNPGLNVMVPVLARVLPETKFLVALRDPRDVVMSCFMQALTLTPASSAYLTMGETVKQYANVMDFWRAMLPRMGAQGMHVRYEEMVDDLPAVARSVLGFLGLGFEDNVLKFHEHARTKRVNSPSYAEVRKPLYRTAVGRWRNYEKYLEPYMPGLEPFVKELNYH
ncbi:MAG TPA: sulfotransferase [Candidatus Binatia bacterium]|jgi:tetratricopeptide (TPR) repeat protein|nr:sulfotransferase [Candidatus Binatia bacterium]